MVSSVNRLVRSKSYYPRGMTKTILELIASTYGLLRAVVRLRPVNGYTD